MEQLTRTEQKNKYIIDTSSILSQKDNEPHRRRVYTGLWKKIDSYIASGIIVTCSEVEEEILDKEIRLWLKMQHCIVLDIDNEIQLNVKKIVSEHPNMIEFTGGRGTSSGDAFLIATAMKYGLTVITEENPDKRYKIPSICRFYGIKTVNITELCDEEHWTFS